MNYRIERNSVTIEPASPSDALAQFEAWLGAEEVNFGMFSLPTGQGIECVIERRSGGRFQVSAIQRGLTGWFVAIDPRADKDHLPTDEGLIPLRYSVDVEVATRVVHDLLSCGVISSDIQCCPFAEVEAYYQ